MTIQILTCPKCGTRVAAPRAEGMRGICPKCLFQALVQPETEPAARSPLELLEGQELGNYVVLGLVGSGGMGVVYRARQKGLERTVALKILNPQGLAGREDVERFFREARAAARLQHPNIVSIHEVANDKGYYFFTMDLVEGRTLADEIHDEKVLRDRVAPLVATIARAVHFAHENGIIHRDLKPANILIDKSGEPKVMDFGLAKEIASSAALTATGTTMGTPAYMSPEQAEGVAVDVRSDVYSLGAVLYECLTGGPPFTGSTPIEILHKVLRDEPTSMGPQVPRDLETICLKGLQKDPAMRYATAAALAEDLERFARGEPILGRRPGVVFRSARFVRRHAVAAALLCVCAALGAVILIRPRPQTPAPTPGWKKVDHSSAALGPSSEDRRRVDHARGRIETAEGLRDPAQRARRNEFLDEAVRELEEVKDPAYADAHFWRGRARRDLNRRTEAIADFTRAVLADPGHELARYWRVATIAETIIHEMQGMIPVDAYRLETMRSDVRALRAMDAAKDRVETAEGLLLAMENAGHAMMSMMSNAKLPDSMAQTFGTIRAHANAALAQNPQNVHARMLLGFIEGMSGPTDKEYRAKAAAEYERALDVSPNEVWIYDGLVLYLLMLGRTDEASRRSDEMLAIAPDFDGSWICRAVVRWALKDREGAEAAFKRALELTTQPEVVHLRRFLCEVGMASEHFDAVEMMRIMNDPEQLTRLTAMLDQALAARPTYPMALFMRGVLRMAAKQYAAGLEDWRLLAATQPELAESLPMVKQLLSKAPPVAAKGFDAFLADVHARALAGVDDDALVREVTISFSTYQAPEQFRALLCELLLVCARRGQVDRELTLLTQLAKMEWNEWDRLEHDPLFATFVKDPAYVELKSRYVLDPAKARAKAMVHVEEARRLIDMAEKVRARDDRVRRNEWLTAALIELDQAVKIDPTCADAHYSRGLALRYLSRGAEAVEAFTRALGADARHADAHYARLLTNAERLFGEMQVMIMPDEYELDLMRADVKALRESGKSDDRYDVAAAYLQAVELTRPAMGVHYAGAKAPEGHEAALAALAAQAQRAKKANPVNPHAHFIAGYAEWLTGLRDLSKIETLIAACESALDLAPNETWISGMLVGLLLNQKRHDEALRRAREMEAAAPDVDESHLAIAKACAHAGDTAAMEAAFEKALAVTKRPAVVHLTRALCLLKIYEGINPEQMRKALSDSETATRFTGALDQALAADPNLPMALFFRGIARLVNGRVAEGADDWRRFSAVAPDVAADLPMVQAVISPPKSLEPVESFLRRVRARGRDLGEARELSIAPAWYKTPEERRAIYEELALAFAEMGYREAVLDTLTRAAQLDWHGWRRVEREPRFKPFAADPAYLELKTRYALAPDEAERMARGLIEKGRQPLENAIKLTSAADRARRQEWLRRAIEQLDRAAEIAPDLAEANFWLGRAYQERQQWSRAMDAYAEALRVDPNHMEARYRRVLAAFAIAEREIQATLSVVDDSLRTSMRDDLEHLRREGAPTDWIETAEGLRAMIETVDLLSSREDARSLTQRLKEHADVILRHADAVMAANPGNGYGLLMRTAARAMGGPRSPKDSSPRQDDFRRAVELEPNDLLFRGNFAQALSADGQNEEALRQAEEAVAIAPESDEALMLRGEILLAAGQAEKAWSDFDRALELTDSPAFIRVRRANRLINNRSIVDDSTYARAMAEFEAALAIDRDYAMALFQRGTLQIRSGRDVERGRADLRRYVKLYPDNPLSRAAEGFLSMPEPSEKAWAFKTPEDMAAKIEPLLADAESRKRLSRQLVEWRIMVEKAEGFDEEMKAAYAMELCFWSAALHAAEGQKAEAQESLSTLTQCGWRDWKRFDAQKAFDSIRADSAVLELRKKFPPEP